MISLISNTRLSYPISFMFLMAIVLLGMLSCARDNVWDEKAIAQSKEIGNVIVTALNKYHAAKGRYPSKLQNMIPEYIEHIENPIAGDKTWIYRSRNDGTEFELIFFRSGSQPPAFFRTSTKDDWGKVEAS